MDMDRFRERRKLTLFVFTLIILFPQIVISTVAFEQHKQYISDRVREMYSLLTTSSMTSWDQLRSLLNQLQKHYFPPNLDFRPRDEGHSGSNDDGDGDGATKERMQDAAGKSLGASKAAVEESAKSAAKVVGEAVHKTTEKVKDCIGGDACHTEL